MTMTHGDVSVGGDTVLECRRISAGYGRIMVVKDVDLRVDAGEVVALLGPNGAGKSTTLLTLAGAIAHTAGEVRLLGESTKAPVHVRCRRGLGFVTEERAVIMGLTAAENLRLAGVEADRAVALFPGLAAVLNRKAGLLSGGEQQMLTLARVLGGDPRVLLADELSLGLAPLIVRRLLEAVRFAADAQGVGVLLVEQHVRQALSFADRVYVMQRGKVVLTGPASEIRERVDEIQAAYMPAFDP